MGRGKGLILITRGKILQIEGRGDKQGLAVFLSYILQFIFSPLNDILVEVSLFAGKSLSFVSDQSLTWNKIQVH